MGTIVNLFCAWICWRMADGAFEEGRNAVGWIGIFISAANGAAVAASLF